MKRSPSPRFKFIGNLVEFESVIMQLFIDRNKDAFIAKWVKEDGNLSQWVMYKVTREQYAKWVSRKLTNRELITKSQEVYMVHCLNDVPYHCELSKRASSDWLPEKNHYFNLTNFNTKTLCLLKTIWQTP